MESGEVTFQEVRTHLGVETQRQWSDLAIARTTPALLGLFSLVTMLADQLTVGTTIPVPRCNRGGMLNPSQLLPTLWPRCDTTCGSPNIFTRPLPKSTW